MEKSQWPFLNLPPPAPQFSKSFFWFVKEIIFSGVLFPMSSAYCSYSLFCSYSQKLCIASIHTRRKDLSIFNAPLRCTLHPVATAWMHFSCRSFKFSSCLLICVCMRIYVCVYMHVCISWGGRKLKSRLTHKHHSWRKDEGMLVFLVATYSRFCIHSTNTGPKIKHILRNFWWGEESSVQWHNI